MFESSVSTARAVPAVATETAGCTMSVSAPPAAAAASQNIYNVRRRLSPHPTGADFFSISLIRSFLNDFKLNIFVKIMIDQKLILTTICQN